MAVGFLEEGMRFEVRYKSFHYQAKSWSKSRRIVAKVEHHQGELLPRVGFLVTNMILPNRSVVRFYNKRGAVDQRIEEGKQATHWTRLSCGDSMRKKRGGTQASS